MPFKALRNLIVCQTLLMTWKQIQTDWDPPKQPWGCQVPLWWCLTLLPSWRSGRSVEPAASLTTRKAGGTGCPNSDQKSICFWWCNWQWWWCLSPPGTWVYSTSSSRWPRPHHSHPDTILGSTTLVSSLSCNSLMPRRLGHLDIGPLHLVAN